MKGLSKKVVVKGLMSMIEDRKDFASRVELDAQDLADFEKDVAILKEATKLIEEMELQKLKHQFYQKHTVQPSLIERFMSHLKRRSNKQQREIDIKFTRIMLANGAIMADWRK